MTEDWKIKVEERLDDHHRRISDLAEDSKNHTAALLENTMLTKQIADNTSEIVELFRGAKGVRSFVLWLTPYLAGIGAIWATVKYWLIGRML
jgi:hypothetical protein